MLDGHLCIPKTTENLKKIEYNKQLSPLNTLVYRDVKIDCPVVRQRQPTRVFRVENQYAWRKRHNTNDWPMTEDHRENALQLSDFSTQFRKISTLPIPNLQRVVESAGNKYLKKELYTGGAKTVMSDTAIKRRNNPESQFCVDR